MPTIADALNSEDIAPKASPTPEVSPSPSPVAGMSIGDMLSANKDTVSGPEEASPVTPIMQEGAPLESSEPESMGDRLKAALYSATNGATQFNLGDEAIAGVVSAVEGIPYPEALDRMNKYSQEIYRKYPKQTALSEAVGNSISLGLASKIPLINKYAQGMTLAGKSKIVDLAKQAGLLSAGGAVRGYFGSNTEGGEYQHPMENAAIGAVAEPVIGGAMHFGMKAAQVLPYAGKKFAEWWSTNRAPNDEVRNQLKEAMTRYKQRVVTTPEGQTKFLIDEIDSKSANELASEILSGFNQVREETAAKTADVALYSQELDRFADAANHLESRIKSKLQNIEIPERLAQQTMDGLNQLQDKIGQASDAAFEALKGDDVTLREVLNAVKRARMETKGIKGYQVLDEKSADNAVTRFAADVRGRFMKKDDKGVYRLIDKPENIRIPAEQVKDLIKSLDRNMEGWYQTAAGQYQGEMGNNVALKNAFKKIRYQLSAGLKENTEYAKNMAEAARLQGVRTDMLDLLRWNSDSRRGVKSALDTIGKSMLEDEHAKIVQFAQDATGYNLVEQMNKMKAAQDILKSGERVVDWPRAGSDLEDSLAKIKIISDILPAEHQDAKLILEQAVERNNWMQDAEDKLFKYIEDNKDLFNKSTRDRLARAQRRGTEIGEPIVSVPSDMSARTLVTRMTKPGYQMSNDDQTVMHALESTGYSGKDLLNKLMDIQAARSLSRQYIQGSRFQNAAQAGGRMIGRMLGRDAMSEAIGTGLAGMAAYSAEQFGPTAARKLFRYSMRKQMAWQRGISSVPASMALAGSNMIRNRVDIKREDPAYNDIMKTMLNDPSLSSEKKLEVMRKFSNGIVIDMDEKDE